MKWLVIAAGIVLGLVGTAVAETTASEPFGHPCSLWECVKPNKAPPWWVITAKDTFFNCITPAFGSNDAWEEAPLVYYQECMKMAAQVQQDCENDKT